jgi:hypothetical protein
LEASLRGERLARGEATDRTESIESIIRRECETMLQREDVEEPDGG